MSVIITFMFEPAKLQMNCASARGRINLRGDITARLGVRASLTPTEFSVTEPHKCYALDSREDPPLGTIIPRRRHRAGRAE
jgi:hypothetical protein